MHSLSPFRLGPICLRRMPIFTNRGNDGNIERHSSLILRYDLRRTQCTDRSSPRRPTYITYASIQRDCRQRRTSERRVHATFKPHGTTLSYRHRFRVECGSVQPSRRSIISGFKTWILRKHRPMTGGPTVFTPRRDRARRSGSRHDLW